MVSTLRAVLFFLAFGAPTTGPSPTNEPISVACQVPGLSKIHWVRSAGEHVKAGTQLCLVESLELREQIQAQNLRVDQALREQRRVSLELMAAEFELEERRARDAEEVARAEEAVRNARALHEIARLRREETQSSLPVVPSAVSDAEQAVQAAEEKITEARRAAETLAKQVIPPRIVACLKAVETAKAREVATGLPLAAALEARGKLEAQLDSQTIRAPSSGILVYAQWRPPGDDRGYARVEPGAYVQYGQILFRILQDRSGQGSETQKSLTPSG